MIISSNFSCSRCFNTLVIKPFKYRNTLSFTNMLVLYWYIFSYFYFMNNSAGFSRKAYYTCAPCPYFQFLVESELQMGVHVPPDLWIGGYRSLFWGYKWSVHYFKQLLWLIEIHKAANQSTQYTETL